MDSMFSFKDFENVHLKATYNLEIGNKTFVKGEPICTFEKIQIAGLTDLNERISANGGYGNRPRVFWDTLKEQRLTFSQGVFSNIQFALFLNARLLDVEADPGLDLTEKEELETNELGVVQLKHAPLRDLFVYNKETGAKITTFILDEDEITVQKLNGQDELVPDPFKRIIVYYVFHYENKSTLYRLGTRLINGFVELEGRTRVKDDTTGRVVTGIIHIPHLKLMSDLSIRLGAQANPIVGNFAATAVPVGSTRNSYVSEFCFLNDDIESDL